MTMRILVWHVHGSWTTAFVHGRHEYLVPVNETRDAYGLGRARTYVWPDSAIEVTAQQLRHRQVDVVVLQRPEELDLVREWLGYVPPAVYVEHNTPRGDVPFTRHPMADRDDLVIAHVSHFNELFWECGGTRTTVVEHGVVPPDVRYDGGLERLAVVTNEPVRRGRVTGTDLIGRFAAVAPLDVYGMGVAELYERDRIAIHDDLPQAAMHVEIAHRRLYLHLCRWTSLGLSLIEAMTIGMPVVALATTEVVRAVPDGAGVTSTKVADLVDAAVWLRDDAGAAMEIGERGKSAALRRYGLDRFLREWDELLEEVTCG
jgi:glycosyltransferase involved in cell wall biosynthesis